MKNILVAAVLTLCTTSVTADTVRIPAGQQGDNVWSGETPRRGITKASVEAQFGTPDSRMGPNGDPPIYYWEYPDFTVYFESDHVIHTVIKHKPKT